MILFATMILYNLLCLVIQMVSRNEMPDVLRVIKETAHLKVKQWVRLKRGIFKDDLAQVRFVVLYSGA